ncbi:MAG: L-lysine 6-transaminase [Planctomycetota bacterium]|jgi:L-lysine 6-transaminase|nr:L-lysine 6-transaminase [Planctomycetota bacterium]MDP6761781.1 L-lysine 6-transaminase [Planctomycetota bacterium]MDP6988922.1 L-lysine 6-transaminase [Planctomycetota bacterium]
MTEPQRVHEILSRHQLADGFPMVVDLARSHGSYLHDARSGEEFLDFFTCFASWPVGYAHPGLEEPAFREELALAAANNPANSDLYTTQMAEFVEAFATRVTPAEYPHHFWVAGGALAVENALKAAFDWKAHKLGVDVVDDGNALVVMHFREAFHGRSGYTLSLTNTDPTKVELFPKFDWPRISNPKLAFAGDGSLLGDPEADEARAVAEMEEAFERHAGRVAAIIIEPLQGEGGDNHFRDEFLAALRRLADEHEALLVFDEVQTGFYGSGQPWLWQTKGTAPDLVAFGKKSQICGFYSNGRIDEVESNVFRRSSRINSTWGGNLVDMVRSRRFIEIIEAERLGENVAARGVQMVEGLRELAADRDQISNVRGVGSLVAFTLDSAGLRDQVLSDLRQRRLLALPCGEATIRFRMPLVVSEDEVRLALERVAACVPSGIGA